VRNVFVALGRVAPIDRNQLIALGNAIAMREDPVSLKWRERCTPRSIDMLDTIRAATLQNAYT